MIRELKVPIEICIQSIVLSNLCGYNPFAVVSGTLFSILSTFACFSILFYSIPSSRANLSILCSAVSRWRCSWSKKVNCDLICFTLNQSWILISHPFLSFPPLPSNPPLHNLFIPQVNRRWWFLLLLRFYPQWIRSSVEFVDCRSIQKWWPKCAINACLDCNPNQVRVGGFYLRTRGRINSNRHFNSSLTRPITINYLNHQRILFSFFPFI